MKGGGPNLRVIDQRSPSRLLAAVYLMLRVFPCAHVISLCHTDSSGNPMTEHQQKTENSSESAGVCTYISYVKKDHFAA